MADIGRIEKREITQEMRESYLDYAMSVIVARALPDVRDGLKPVHRRILYAMHELGLSHSAKYRKSAAIVGEVLGKYHPHGDIAVYDSLVRMAQPFSLRYPLVDGQGNFGSIDADAAAAMRYCVTGDTLVTTDQGLVPIENISEKKSENISISVLSYDRKVSSATKWFDSGEHPTLKLTTQQGLTIQGSHNHPLLTWSKNLYTGIPEFQWKLLSQIKTGEVMVIDRTPDALWPKTRASLSTHHPSSLPSRVQHKILPHEFNEDLASLLGALTAEGTIKDKEIEFCNSDEGWINDFENKWKRVFPDCRLHRFQRKPNSYGRKAYYTLEIHSQHVIQFLRNIGLAPLKSTQRRVPRLIFQSPKPVVAAFLRAYFEGDGSISYSSKMTELSCVSKSETLLQEIQTILLRFDIVATKRFDAYRDIYKIYLRGLENYKKFHEQIGFLSTRKNKKMEDAILRLHKEYSLTDAVPFISEYMRAHLDPSFSWRGRKEFVFKNNFDRYPAMKQNSSAVLAATEKGIKANVQSIFEHLLANHYLFDSVTSVEDGGIKRVYSLRVNSSCHSYVANGFINHNTEARTARITDELLKDIDKDTVNFRPNYDDTREEPTVLPSAIPNLLLNGTLGIAVGMATNIPPHNLIEVIDGLLHLIAHPQASNDDLMEFVKGPDFPTGGIIYNEKAIREAYATGRGGVLNRGKAEIEEGTRGMQIVVTEIPYLTVKAEWIEAMANLVHEKKLEGIRDIRDESDKDGLRVVIELKQDAQPQKVLNNLYKHTDLEKMFHLNMIALVDGIQPQVLSLKTILEEFIKHRVVVVTRRTQFDLARTRERIHILEGLKKALDHIDRVIETIKKSADKDEAHANLMKKFGLSDLQATAILEMRLQTLAGLERQKIEDELREKLALAASLEALLKDPRKIREVVKKELVDIKEKYGDERKTRVVKSSPKELSDEDLVPDEEVVVVQTRGGYIKRIKPESYRMQRRGGKGLIGIETKEEDVVEHLLTCSTHASLLFFTNSGKVYQVPAYEIPEGSRTAKGKAIFNFLSLTQTETVTSILAIAKEKKKRPASTAEQQYILMLTRDGIIKKVEADSFENVRKSGLIAITLKGNDALQFVKLTGGKDEIIMMTSHGQAIRFSEKDVRPMGRQAAGVKAMRLKKDTVVGMDVVTSETADGKLLVIMAHGYGKQTLIKQYKKQNRGGSGIKTAKVTPKTGEVVRGQMIGQDESELIAISRKGQVIRTELATIPVLNRATQGVRIMKLEEGDAIATITTL